MTALNGRDPLVIDVQELGRRAGGMMTIERSVPAPDDLTNPMIAIPVGSNLDLDMMAESVIEGVLVTGTVSATAAGTCSRCLEPVSEVIELDVQELYQHADLAHEGSGDGEGELPSFEDNLIDLEPAIRDAAVLALPLAPLCSEDCLGLCADCGVRMEDDPTHQHERLDERWSALQKLITDDATPSRDERRG